MNSILCKASTTAHSTSDLNPQTVHKTKPEEQFIETKATFNQNINHVKNIQIIGKKQEKLIPCKKAKYVHPSKRFADIQMQNYRMGRLNQIAHEKQHLSHNIDDVKGVDTVQIKIPVFKDNHFQQLRKSQVKRLGLSNFFNSVELSQQKNGIRRPSTSTNQILRDIQHIQQLKSNQIQPTVDHIDVHTKRMVNSLGIKKSNSTFQGGNVDWTSFRVAQIQHQWNEIGYIPNRYFPCRRNQSQNCKKMFSSNRPKQNPNKYIIQDLTHKRRSSSPMTNQMINNLSKMMKKSSGSALRRPFTAQPSKSCSAKTSQKQMELYRKRHCMIQTQMKNKMQDLKVSGNTRPMTSDSFQLDEYVTNHHRKADHIVGKKLFKN